MNKRNGSNLTLLLGSMTLAFISGNTFSQNIEINTPSNDCVGTEAQSTDATAMAARLSCYDHKLGNLTEILSKLIKERKNLNNVIGTFEQDTQHSPDNSHTTEQQQTIRQLQLERAELRAQLHRVLSEKQPVQLHKDTNERLFRNYSEAYTALSIENTELRKLVAEYQSSANSYQTTAAELQEINEQQSTQVNALSNQITGLRQTIADLSTRKKELTNKFNRADSRITLMKKQLLTNAALIKLKQDRVESLQQAQIESSADSHTAEKNLTRITDQHAETVSNLIATKEKLYQQINTLTEDRNLIRKQSKQASLNSMATMSARDKEIAALSNELNTLNATHKNVIAKLATTNQEQITTNEAYTAEIASLNNKTSALNSTNTQLTKAVDDRDTAIEALQTQIQEHNVKLERSTQKIVALEVKLEIASKAKNKLSEAKSSALDSNSTLTEQLGKRLTQLNALQNERDNLAVELNVARPELTNLTKNIAAKNSENIMLEQTIASLQSELQHADTATAELQSKLTSSERNSSAATEKVKTLTAAVTSLENIVNESINSNKHIEDTLADIKTDLEASQKRLDSKQSQLQKLMAEKRALIKAHNTLANEAKKLAANIKQKLNESEAGSVVVTRLEDNSLLLRVDSSQLFRTGSSKLSKEGQNLLLGVGNAIGTIEKRQIMIEGHSDNIPLGVKLSKIFKDNLGLSMARALSTAKFFTDNTNIPANRMSVSGAGATKPMASNDTSEGRQKNRRVEILLLPATSEPLASLK